MRRSSLNPIPLLATLLIGLGCESPTTVSVDERLTISVDAVAGPPLDGATSLDTWLLSKAREVPGFAGMYYEEGGRLVVRLLDTDRLAQAQAAISERAVDFPDQAGIRAVKADYDFAQLYDWRTRARATVFDIAGVISLDIDEVRNRLVFGITDDAARESILARIERLDIPLEAVLVLEEDLRKAQEL